MLYQISPTLLKNSLWHRRFPLDSAKFLRIPFLQNTPGRLLLLIQELVSNIRSINCYPKYKSSRFERKEGACLKDLLQLLMIIFCHINCSCRFLKKKQPCFVVVSFLWNVFHPFQPNVPLMKKVDFP